MQEASRTLAQEVQSQLARMQSQRLSGFHSRALAWLVLPPGWTVELAGACRFPAGDKGLPAFLKEAQAAGIVKLENLEDTQTPTDFWVPPAERPGLLDWIKQQLDLPELQNIVCEIGRALQPYLPADDALTAQNAVDQFVSTIRTLTRNSPADVHVPENIAQWGRLAEKMEDVSKAADWLDTYIVQLLDKNQTGEAISWLEMARPLAELFGGSLETAVRLGARRLELVYRRQQDVRQLKNFQERQEQLQPFHYLLRNTDKVWALHYLGVGGVGKTMLLRFISAGCPGSSLSLPVPYVSCRVDFDYIKPDFPYKKPGQLLLELAAELRLHGVTITSLRKFSTDVEAFHSMLASHTQGVYDLAGLIQGDYEIADQFRRMLKRFYKLVTEVADVQGERIVVMILDTCEELAKVPSPEGKLVAVEATYFLLERLEALHRELHGERPLPFRIIFSGRRPLAQSGFQWNLKEGQVSGKRLILPNHIRYLALHELRGFDHDDMKAFYCKKKQMPRISSQAYKAILRSSQESGRSAQVESKLGGYRPRRYRYNPFDLDLFADWLLSEPDLSPDEIASGREDPYIEYRILKRLHSQTLEKMLPHLVLLERVDETLLRLLCRELGETDFDHVFRELSDQEWIDFRTIDEQETTFLEIDTNLLPRLHRYFGIEDLPAGGEYPEESEIPLQDAKRIPQNRTDQVEQARELLGSLLRDIILGGGDKPPVPLNALSAHYIDAALRLLPPVEGAQVWEAVERRIPTELGWASTSRFLEGILAEEFEKEHSSHPLWAGIRAAQVSALIHGKPGASRSVGWQEIEQTAGRYPEGPGRERLVLRSLFGRYAAVDFHLGIAGLPNDLEDHTFLEAAFSTFGKTLSVSPEILSSSDALALDSQQLLASACAALANYLDVVEYSLSQGGNFTPPIPTDYLQGLEARLNESPIRPDLAAWAHILIGRLLNMLGDRDAAWTIMRTAANQVQVAVEKLERYVWLDWVPPDDLHAHLCLQALRAFPITPSPADEAELSAWRMVALNGKGRWNIDSERLASATLITELKYRPVALESVEQLGKVWDGTCFSPDCCVHEQTPLLILALARSFMALGLSRQALDLLTKPAESARESILVQAARQGYLECIRRMRVNSRVPWVKDWMESQDVIRASLAWPAEYLNGNFSIEELKNLLPEDPQPIWSYLWNRLQRRKEGLVIGGSTESVNISGSQWEPPFNASYEEDALTIDGLEKTSAFSARSSLPQSFDSSSWLQLHPAQVESALRLGFQVAMLKEEIVPAVVLKQRLGALVEQVPIRRRAEIALEEGELRALRSPQAAQNILLLARDWFEEAGDAFGGLQANICISLAQARQGNSEAILKEYLQRTVRGSYEACRLNHPELPTWEILLQKESTERYELNKVLVSGDNWIGWVSHLLAAHLATLPDGKRQIQTLRDPFVRHLPPEVNFQKAATVARQEGWLEFLGSWIAGIVAVMTLVATLLSGVFNLPRLFEALTTLLRNLGLSSFQAAPLVALVAGFSLLVLDYLRLYLKGLGRLDLAVHSTRREAALTFSLHRKSMGLRSRWPIFYWKKMTWSWHSNSLQEIPKEEPPSEWYISALKHLKGLVSNPVVQSIPFAVNSSEQRDQILPWEQIWAEKLGEENPLAILRKLGVHRISDGLDQGSSSWQIGWKLGLVRLVCSDSAAGAVSRGWQGNTPAFALTYRLPASPELNEKSFAHQELVRTAQRPNELRAFREQASGMISGRNDLHLPYRVLHLVGAPISTTTGLAWQIISATSTEAVYQQRTYETGYSSEIITAGRIPVSLAALVILQGEPSNAPLSSLLDEVQATDLRAFACTLTGAGARAVLVLPPLPFAWTTSVVRAVARALQGTNPPDERRLLSAALSARLAIARFKLASIKPEKQVFAASAGPSGTAEEQKRLALQVCLFLRSNKEDRKNLKVHDHT